MQDILPDSIPKKSLGEETNLDAAKARGILNILPEAIFLAHLPAQETPSNPVELTYFNSAFSILLGISATSAKKQHLDGVFEVHQQRMLFEALNKCRAMQTPQSVGISLRSGKNISHYNVKLTLDGAFGPNHILGLMTDTTELTSRAGYLEDRAVKLIDHANVLEASRRDLENEIIRLRKSIKTMERAAKYDKATGMPNRSHFLEKASAEFQRSVRYGHELSVVVVNIRGVENVNKAHGPTAADTAMMGLGQICESACRGGIDFAGRIDECEIAVLLPETSLSGALLFEDRLTDLISKTPLQMKKGLIRLGARTGIDALQTEDHSFSQMLARIQAGFAKRTGSGKPPKNAQN